VQLFWFRFAFQVIVAVTVLFVITNVVECLLKQVNVKEANGFPPETEQLSVFDSDSTTRGTVSLVNPWMTGGLSGGSLNLKLK
jgi:hypothetical protein